MKIVLVVDYFAPAWGYGGPPRLVATLADQLLKMGHDVAVLTTDALDANRFHSAQMETYRVVRARNLSNQLAWTRKIFLPIPPASVLSIFRSVDVIHLFQARSLLNGIAYLGARQEHAPLVLSPLGGLPLVGGWDRVPKRLYDAAFSKTLMKNLGAALGQTSHEVSVCRSWGVDGRNVHLVPLCVNLSDYENLPSKGRFLSKLPHLRDFEQRYIFIGRIHPYKGLEMLIEAFSRAFPHEKNALIIAGKDEGGHVSYLKTLALSLGIGNRVFFEKPIYGAAKLEALVDSHAFVITPSIYEETSLAALEAAACETPVITTVQAEIPWLEEYSAGFTLSYGLDSIVEGLRKMSSVVGESRYLMGKMSRRLIKDHFSPAEVAKQLERVYASLRDE